jgi:hypothetical protein
MSNVVRTFLEIIVSLNENHSLDLKRFFSIVILNSGILFSKNEEIIILYIY